VTLIYRLDGRLRYGVRYGAKLALPVQKWPQNGLSGPTPPIFTSSMLLLCADATQCLNDLEAGLGLYSSGEGPGSGLHGNSKSDAVLHSCSIICVVFINNCCIKKRNVMGRNWSQTAKLRSKSYCTVAPSLYGLDRTFQTYRTSTVLYGTNTVRTV